MTGLEDLKKFQFALTKTNKKLAEAKKKLRDQKGESDANAKAVVRLTAQQKIYKAEVDKGIKSMVRQKQALKSSSVQMRKTALSSRAAGKGMAAMGAKILGASVALRQLGMFLVSSVKEFAKFEQGVKSVTTLMSSEDTGLFRGKLFEGAIDISRDFGFAMNDVTKAMFNAVSAGVEGGNAVQFLNDASTLAVAGVTDLKSATLGLTTVLNAYGMEASEASKVSEILFTTQKFGVTTVEELSKSLGVVVPFAAASGVSLEELGASIAVTTRSGLDAAKTVTALRAAISQMQKPAAESRDLFIKFGIPIGAAQMKAVGFTETMRRLNQAYKESPRDIERMFGNVRGLTAIFSIAGENASEYNKFLEELNNESLRSNNVMKAQDEQMNSTQFKINQMTSAWNNFKISLGDSEWSKNLIDQTTTVLDVATEFGAVAAMQATWYDGLRNFTNDQLTQIGLEGIIPYLDKIRGTKTQIELLTEEMKQNNIDAVFENLKSYEGQIDNLADKANKLEELPKGYKTMLNEIVKETEKINLQDPVTMNLLTLDQMKMIDVGLAYKESLKMQADADKEAKDKEKDRIDAANKAKAKAEMAYNTFELNAREALAEKKQKIAEEALETEEYAIETNIKNTRAELLHLEKLQNQFGVEGFRASEEEKLRVKTALGKARVKLDGLLIKQENSNRKSYDDEQTERATALAKFKQDEALEQAEKGLLTNEQFRIYMLELDEEYYEGLLELDGQSADEKEKNEEALAAIRIKLAKQVTDVEREQNKLKAKYATEALTIIGDAVKANAEATLENRERQLDKEMEMADEELESGLINNREHKKKEEEIEKEKFEMRKEHEKKMLKISLAQELANIAVQAAANPLAPITFGAASISQYAIMSALALARHAMNLATIDKQKFALGGMVYGKSHSQGGETFAVGGQLAELEGGEAVINKRSAAMFGNALSAMNVAGGGVSFASPNLSGNNDIIDYNKIGEVIGKNTNVVLPVENLSKVQNKVKTTQNSVKF